MSLTIGFPMLGFRPWTVLQLWRYWPLSVICVGVALVLPPLLFRGRRGLGGMFIPALPVLTTGGLLLFSSVFDWWEAWSWLWPFEVLSVAVAFLLAAAYMRVIWLLIPSIIIGANGLLFLFCAVTGLWEVWAVMWTIEPLSVGLALLLIGGIKRRHGLMLAGLILCIIGGVGLVGMASVMSLAWFASWVWLFRFLVPIALVLVGASLLVWSLGRKTASFKVH
jgi:hypothetical protein